MIFLLSNVDEDYVCTCGTSVQTEEHVLLECDLVTPIKEKYRQEVVCFDFHAGKEN